MSKSIKRAKKANKEQDFVQGFLLGSSVSRTNYNTVFGLLVSLSGREPGMNVLAGVEEPTGRYGYVFNLVAIKREPAQGIYQFYIFLVFEVYKLVSLFLLEKVNGCS